MDNVTISRNSKLKIYHARDCMYAKRIDQKYKRIWPKEKALSKGYKPCSWCGGIHGTYLFLRDYPRANVRELQDLKLSYDRDTKSICFRTDIGFWKVREKYNEGYKLFHLNRNCFDQAVSDHELMKRNFHRQVDVDTTTRINKIIKYIADHDKAKKIMEENWRNLPKQTKKQKDYYKQARKRERRKSIRRVDDIFKQLEEERKNKNG